MKKTTAIKLIIATPIFMLLANYLAIFAQEYAHSITAWLLGYKDHPFAIHFGGTSLLNLLLLLNVNANVDYDLIISSGHLRDLAWIAFAGLGLANGGLYLLSLSLLKKKFAQRMTLIFYFLFWFNFMNFAQIFTFIPVRVFSEEGDIANIVQGLNISPWWICIIFGYAITYIIWHFFTRTLIRAYDVLQITSLTFRSLLMMSCAIPLFGYFGVAGFIDSGEISHFLSSASLFLLPGVMAACWPMPTLIETQTEHTMQIQVEEHIEVLAGELAMPSVSLDEAHFLENFNAVLGERDAKIRESEKKLKNKLSKTRK